MEKIRKGDIVGRLSYGKDILFLVDRIIRAADNQEYAILKGITFRIEADSDLDDLEKIEDYLVKRNMRSLDDRLDERVQNCVKCNTKPFSVLERGLLKREQTQEIVYTGKILHLDGDKKYSNKSIRYYQDLGLNAIVRNIPENMQSKMVYNLLMKYKPDILVITGHDGMIKSNSGYHDIYNYRNSKHFIDTVKEARKWDEENESKLVIFAGACQSYFEALMRARC